MCLNRSRKRIRLQTSLRNSQLGRVRAWQARWLTLTFSEKRGIHFAIPLLRGHSRGFAYLHAFRWFVVYQCDGEMRLYADGRIVKVGLGVWVSDSTEGCEMILKVDGQELLRLPRPRRPHRWQSYLDPTFDSLDADESDFFGWVERLWKDAELRKDLIRRWTSQTLQSEPDPTQDNPARPDPG